MINEEAFRLVELSGPAGITADVLASRLGITLPSARSWLSKWTNKGYLKHIMFEGHIERTERRGPGRPKGSAGMYVIGNRDWGDIRWMSGEGDVKDD